jgi:hypothetical protein
LVIGFQPSTVQPLLSDTGTGLAQRFTFASATDPSIPDVPPAWPGEIKIKPGYTDITFDAAVTAVIRTDVLARVRGEAAEGDEHGMLTKARLGALLAALHGESHVDGRFWELAGLLWGTSCTVRESLRQAGKADAERQETVTNQRMARREVVKVRAVEDDLLDRAVTAAARYITANPGCTERDAWNGLNSKLRKNLGKTGRAEVFERLKGAGLLSQA